MATWWDTIQIKKGGGGCGDVTEEEKNSNIDHAVSAWENMGLTEDQIAFGIGIMGMESGFNPKAEGVTRSSKEHGLGQFTRGTWEEAVKHYNTRPDHKSRHERDIDPVKDKDDLHSQIAVIGARIPEAWGRVAGIPVRQRPKGYGFDELAYGKWHEGINKPVKGLGKFLGDPRYNNPNMRGYFTKNVDRARQALRMRKTNKGIAVSP